MLPLYMRMNNKCYSTEFYERGFITVTNHQVDLPIDLERCLRLLNEA